MTTIPSVDPTSDTSFAGGVKVAICMESDDALKFLADTSGRSKFTEASTKTSVMNIKAIPKIYDVFMLY
jgi:hypothetical protein